MKKKNVLVILMIVLTINVFGAGRTLIPTKPTVTTKSVITASSINTEKDTQKKTKVKKNVVKKTTSEAIKITSTAVIVDKNIFTKEIEKKEEPKTLKTFNVGVGIGYPYIYNIAFAYKPNIINNKLELGVNGTYLIKGPDEYTSISASKISGEILFFPIDADTGFFGGISISSYNNLVKIENKVYEEYVDSIAKKVYLGGSGDLTLNALGFGVIGGYRYSFSDLLYGKVKLGYELSNTEEKISYEEIYNDGIIKTGLFETKEALIPGVVFGAEIGFKF